MLQDCHDYGSISVMRAHFTRSVAESLTSRKPHQEHFAISSNLEVIDLSGISRGIRVDLGYQNRGKSSNE